MKLTIEGKKYETGKFSPSVVRECIKYLEQFGVDDQGDMQKTIEAMDTISYILCKFLISGTEKIPYRQITIEKIEELRPIIEDNFTFIELTKIFTDLMNEMNTGGESSEKLKA